MLDALRRHWPEYLIEGACLALFMISAFTFGTFLEHRASPIHQAIPNPLSRRFLMGLAMGTSAIAIIYSLGANNPAPTSIRPHPLLFSGSARSLRGMRSFMLPLNSSAGCWVPYLRPRFWPRGHRTPRFTTL